MRKLIALTAILATTSAFAMSPTTPYTYNLSKGTCTYIGPKAQDHCSEINPQKNTATLTGTSLVVHASGATTETTFSPFHTGQVNTFRHEASSGAAQVTVFTPLTDSTYNIMTTVTAPKGDNETYHIAQTMSKAE